MFLDNKKNGKVGDALREHLTKGAKLSVISGLFSIYGFESLKNELTLPATSNRPRWRICSSTSKITEA